MVQISIDYLEKKNDFDEEERVSLVSSNKMLGYLLSSIFCIIEDHIADNSNNNNIENIGRV